MIPDGLLPVYGHLLNHFSLHCGQQGQRDRCSCSKRSRRFRSLTVCLQVHYCVTQQLKCASGVKESGQRRIFYCQQYSQVECSAGVSIKGAIMREHDVLEGEGMSKHRTLVSISS